MLLYLPRSGVRGTGGLRLRSARCGYGHRPTGLANAELFTARRRTRPRLVEDRYMAGAINPLNEDRSRLAWRGRQAGGPSEIIDELIKDNIRARYSRRFRLFLQGAAADGPIIIINGVGKVQCAQ